MTADSNARPKISEGLAGAILKSHVLIVDDHALIRSGLRQALADQPDMVVGEAKDGREALDSVKKQNWDIVLLDISLPDKGGLEVLEELKRNFPKLPVLVLSAHPESQYAMRAFADGASGYLTKESAPGELVQAIHKVLSGGRYVSAGLAEVIAGNLNPDKTKSPHERLSDREYEVLKLIASGKTVSMIGHHLCLSVKTISTYRARILEKTGFKTNSELTRYALENKLV